jgi:hypothetical protein
VRAGRFRDTDMGDGRHDNGVFADGPEGRLGVWAAGDHLQLHYWASPDEHVRHAILLRRQSLLLDTLDT